MLSTATADHPFHWDDHLCRLCMVYNTSTHPTTGFTLFYLMFGHQARMPIEIMYGSPNSPDYIHSEYVTQLCNQLEGAYQRVRETMGHKLDRQKDYYDKRVHGNPTVRKIWSGNTPVLFQKKLQRSYTDLGPAPSVSKRFLNILTGHRMCKHPDAVLSSILTASNCALQKYDFQQIPRVIPSSLHKAISSPFR